MQALRWIVAGLCVLLGLFALWLVPQQLSTTGFAASRREPNYLAYYLSLGAAILALLNLLLALGSRQPTWAWVACGVALGLLVLDVYLYFATW